MNPIARLLALLLGASLLASACGSSGPTTLEFGIRRLALDIAFEDEDAAPPVEPEVIVRIVPAPPAVLEPGFDFGSVQRPPEEPPPPIEFPEIPLFDCPEAPPDATVLLTASPAVIDPPAPGTYPRSNQGTITITSSATPLPISLPYPFISSWEVLEPTIIEGDPGPLGGDPPVTKQFTIEKVLGPGFSTVEAYQIGDAALQLLERTSIANGAEVTFRTTPPLDYFTYGAEGDTWTSSGADIENGFGVLIQANNADREIIDVCGELIDTFRIEYTEQVVDLASSDTSGTDADETTIINIAPQYGGLVVREEFHSTQRTSVDGSPVVIEFDYVSTLTSIEPL